MLGADKHTGMLCFYAFRAHFLFPIMDMDEGLLLSLQLTNDPLDKSRD